MDKLANAFEAGILFNKTINAIVLMVLGAFFAAFIVRRHIFAYLLLRGKSAKCGNNLALSFTLETHAMFNQMKIGMSGVLQLKPVDGVGTALPLDTPIEFDLNPVWTASPPELAKTNSTDRWMSITPLAIGDLTVKVRFKIKGKEEVEKSAVITIGAGDVADLSLSFEAK